MKSDIENLQHIQQLVDGFYGNVQKDPLIGPIFIGIIKNWPDHLAKMYRFWQTVLLDEHTYQGQPFFPHGKMPLTANHFERWLSIWTDTVDSYFEGPKAEEAKTRAQAMATMFLSKIEYIRKHNSINIL